MREKRCETNRDSLFCFHSEEKQETKRAVPICFPRKWQQQQYTHGAIWSIIANAKLRNGERASEYFRILNPIEHARTKEQVLRYRCHVHSLRASLTGCLN